MNWQTISIYTHLDLFEIGDCCGIRKIKIFVLYLVSGSYNYNLYHSLGIVGCIMLQYNGVIWKDQKGSSSLINQWILFAVS